MNICTGPECDREVAVVVHGLCKTHNTQRLRGVELTPIGSTVKAPEQSCSVEFCERSREGRKDLCRAHRRQKDKGKAFVPVGERLGRPRETTYKRMCLKFRCKYEATMGEFCYFHRGDARFEHNRTCKVDGCLRVATFIPDTGACVEHGGTK